MRRRLTFVIVGVTTAALILSGLFTLLLIRRAALEDSRQQLVREGVALAQGAENVTRPGVLAALAAALKLRDQAVVTVNPAGVVRGDLPPGVRVRDLNVTALREGRVVSGVHGQLAYAAVPAGGQRVIVLTRKAAGVRQGAGYFLLSAAVVIVLAIVVAQWLASRFARPLREAEAATRRIAGGDLDARVPIPPDTDIELASLSHSINVMAAELARSKGLESQFLLSVSHDLRTPLTSIRGFAEAIADGAAPDATRAAGVITAEARRLERLVQDLLELAKLDAHRFSLAVQDLDVAAIAADTADGFLPTAADHGIALTASAEGTEGVAGSRFMARADPDRVAQVLANLIENAISYAGSSVRVWTHEGGPGWVALTVDDDGPGIPAADLPRVFDRLYQGDRRSARHVGSGLGLAIVHELVTAMGGAVSAASPVPGAGTGTRMTVLLPAT